MAPFTVQPVVRHTPLSLWLAAGFVLATAAVRAQDGAPPFASPVAPVSFTNGGVRLAGGILTPEGSGPFPAVVLVHGAGPATLAEPAFRVHANAFVRAGFVVLLYDKRGSGQSTGVLSTSDYDDLAGDIAAGVQLLRARPDVAPDRIGLLGRSEGGWTGTLAASRDPTIAFVILSSGSAIRPSEQTMFSTQRALRTAGASAEESKAGADAKAALWAYYRRVVQDVTWARTAEGRAARDAVIARLAPFARFGAEVPQNVADPATTPLTYFQAFVRKIDFDPGPVFRSVRAPLLEIIGANDEVVEPERTTAVFDRLRADGRDVTVRVLSGVGHSLLVAGQAPRYPEDYPEFAVRWARERVDRVAGPPGAPYGTVRN